MRSVERDILIYPHGWVKPSEHAKRVRPGLWSREAAGASSTNIARDLCSGASTSGVVKTYPFHEALFASTRPHPLCLLG